MDTNRDKQYAEEIKKHLSAPRFYHSLNVADEAKKLALKYGADPDKAFTAGILHDIMKDTDKKTQLEIFSRYGVCLTDTEKSSPKTWHAMSAALYIENELGVTDREIITAVRYHTTARAGMSLLEKVLYIADYISADRNYEDVDVMRIKAYKSLEEAMLYGLQFTINENVQKGYPIHPDSIYAYNEVAVLQQGKEK